jgi:hypothetical protein
VKNWNWIAFSGALAVSALSCNVAKAQDVCNTNEFVREADEADKAEKVEAFEKKVRGKCKAGDVIFVLNNPKAISRLCDFHQYISEHWGVESGGRTIYGHMCVLAAPRKEY